MLTGRVEDRLLGHEDEQQQQQQQHQQQQTDTVLAMREFLPSGSAEVLAASSLDLVAAVPATHSPCLESVSDQELQLMVQVLALRLC